MLQNADLRQSLSPTAGAFRPWNIQPHCCHTCQKNARYDTPYFGEIMDRRGLTGDDRAKTLEVYQKFQEQDIAILDGLNAGLYDWAETSKPHRTCQYEQGLPWLGVDSCPIEGFAYKGRVNQLLADGACLTQIGGRCRSW